MNISNARNGGLKRAEGALAMSATNNDIITGEAFEKIWRILNKRYAGNEVWGTLRAVLLDDGYISKANAEKFGIDVNEIMLTLAKTKKSA